MRRRPREKRGIDMVARPERVEAALWRHALHDLAAARDGLFSYYVRFARAIARERFLARRAGNHELGDVEQLAYEGLLQAIDRFEPLRSVPFQAFARPRIFGSISNGLGKYSEAAANSSYHRRTERERLQSLMPGSSGPEESPAAAFETDASTRYRADPRKNGIMTKSNRWGRPSRRPMIRWRGNRPSWRSATR